MPLVIVRTREVLGGWTVEADRRRAGQPILQWGPYATEQMADSQAARVRRELGASAPPTTRGKRRPPPAPRVRIAGEEWEQGRLV